MFNALPFADARKDTRFFILPIFGDKHVTRLADYLFRRIAKQGFGAFIPGKNNSIEVFGNNSVIGGIDDCSEEIPILRVSRQRPDRGEPVSFGAELTDTRLGIIYNRMHTKV